MKKNIGDWFGIVLCILGMGIAIYYIIYVLTGGYNEIKFGDPLYYEKEQLRHIDDCHKLGGKVVYNYMNKFDGCLEK